MLTDFATKTEIIYRNNVSVDNYWPIGIDYGFSSVKGFSPNKVFCFPNCAVQVDSFNRILDTSDSDILLRDEEGCWIIGAKAHDVISPEKAMNYESEMYERNRYFTPAFSALMKVGLGIALMSNQFRTYNGETIVIQTGLPPKYRKGPDASDFAEALAGDYKFELKLGRAPFRKFEFRIAPDNIAKMMDQPQGALFSTITDNDATIGAFGRKIFKSNTIVLDPGFKTFDTYDIAGGTSMGDGETFELGMYEIFRRTINDIKQTYGTNITILGMQEALHTGFIRTFDRRKMASKKVVFTEELEKNTKEVCMEAIQKTLSIYNYLQNHDYVIVTGGTGAAWYPIMEDFFRDMESLTLLNANSNDRTLPNTYSNVRGYYLFLVGLLMRRARR